MYQYHKDLFALLFIFIFCNIIFLYRKYIEDVLKTRGLRKSLHFLERLHITVLRKARLALEKPQDDSDSNVSEEYEGDQELRRYGSWSREAKELNLPSYK